jgi:hypothetical protein
VKALNLAVLELRQGLMALGQVGSRTIACCSQIKVDALAIALFAWRGSTQDARHCTEQLKSGRKRTKGARRSQPAGRMGPARTPCPERSISEATLACFHHRGTLLVKLILQYLRAGITSVAITMLSCAHI